MKSKHVLVTAIFLGAMLSALPTPAAAEAKEVNIVQSYGLVVLPTYVVVDQHLIEKNAAKAGLGNVTVKLAQLASTVASGDMLISGNADVVAGGITTMLNLWDKTRGAMKVRAITPLCDSPVIFYTTDSRIKTIRDFKEGDQIAVSAIKVSVQAIVLEMAAAKEFGWDQRLKLDPLTVALSAPDAAAALLSGGGEFKTWGSFMPYTYDLRESGKVHEVLNSLDVLGPSINNAAFTTERFRSENPRLYAAIAESFEQAIEFINNDKRGAAEVYVKYEKQSKGAVWVAKMLEDEKLIKFTSTPHEIGKLADFMYKLGALKTKAASWKDFFFSNMYAKAGS